MALSQSDVEELYTTRIDRYESFIDFFRTSQGLRAVLRQSDLLRPDLRVLDAGCGFGSATFALIDALRAKNLGWEIIDAFDLTPAMLTRFSKRIDDRRAERIRVQRADVLELQALPHSWRNYDLVLSTSMLEYLRKHDLSYALAGLRERMAPAGRILVMITRRTPEARILVEWGWKAQSYSKPEIVQSFEAAGLRNQRFLRFPLRYAWLNRANYVVTARC
jgi:cyclopropane fatty-acyl-phospholipid synthase-like methyltransferase